MQTDPPKMMQDLARWAKAESKALRQDFPMGSQAEKELIQHWTTHRPKMVAMLTQMRALKPLAHVLVDRKIEAAQTYQRAGMPPPDAQEQAVKDWLLMEPEQEDDQQVAILTSRMPEAEA